MITIPKLEMHVADACNLRCGGCNHYANFGLKGVLPIEQGSAWIRSWCERVAPVHFSFLGGEPLINPELGAYLTLARAVWPHARLRLVTNGLLLDRRSDLWPVLEQTRTTLFGVDPLRRAGLPGSARPTARAGRHRGRAAGSPLRPAQLHRRVVPPVPASIVQQGS